MGKWLHMCARYLHLLLENEGLTRAPACSICDTQMVVKCSDCLGANYFCRTCCIHSHKWTPFHWLAHWTNTHFRPVSLHSLGFILFLGHHGDPCPLTVEASLWYALIICLLTHYYKGIQALQAANNKLKHMQHTHSSSLKPVMESHAALPDQAGDLHTSGNNSEDMQGVSTTLFEPSMDDYTKSSHRVCTAKLGNPLITVVDQSGIFDLEVLYCVFPNATAMTIV
jgi:hypothetical protein